MRHHGVRADDATQSDLHIRKYNTPHPQKTAIPNLYASLVVRNQRSNFDIQRNAVERVSSIYDRTVGCNRNIIADEHAMMTHDVDILLDIHVPSDSQFRAAQGVEYHDLKACTPLDGDFRTYMHITWLRDCKRRVKKAASIEAAENHWIVESRLESSPERTYQCDPLVKILSAYFPE